MMVESHSASLLRSQGSADSVENPALAYLERTKSEASIAPSSVVSESGASIDHLVAEGSAVRLRALVLRKVSSINKIRGSVAPEAAPKIQPGKTKTPGLFNRMVKAFKGFLAARRQKPDLLPEVEREAMLREIEETLSDSGASSLSVHSLSEQASLIAAHD